ncbi:hypothetical protein BJV82DRAFT_664526 [Fennellomyces sp. T-0311]|nr:hypothetical protein BJV82DRAFT_664526 [Fennellomyces sp. T-0311]
MDDSFGFDDDDAFLAAAVEQIEKQTEERNNAPTITIDDEFEDFDDFDDAELIRATEAVEQQASRNKGKGRQQQQQLTSFFTSPNTSATAASSSSAQPTATQSAPVRQWQSELLPSRRLEDEEPPEAPAPPVPHATCAHEFDAEALPTWIYPVNYPVRLYQWNIVTKALFNNTLVALPTGLGKTFIAAVVMYNYYRWFPHSKIVFMAPTRPLVTQQIQACFEICGIPQSDTVEMTGQTSKEKRRTLWNSKRVYFLTPQVMQNDLQSRICPAEKVACLVIDEAHKAQGSYAYTEVVKLIAKRQSEFRVLALTATPGTNVTNVQSVITNLRITNIQIRTEESMDIQAHSHGKNIQTIVVKLDYMAGATGIIPEIIKDFRTKLFEPVLRRLSRFQAIYSTDVERNTPFQLLTAQRNFTANARNFNNAVKAMVHTDFSIAQSISRAYDLLCQHGAGPFLDTIEDMRRDFQATLDSGKRLSKEKMNLMSNFDLKRITERLEAERKLPGFVAHPKQQRLLHIVLEHLSECPEGTSTRIIVFSTFRNSVNEIVKHLSEHEPMVKCSQFVGQSDGKNGRKGLNQREQNEIIGKFKNGDINVLVSTSIGEEGLDIGEVDLIICYDSQSSPLRLLQRMGRTGRKRKGRCVMLMTEAEERKYKQAKESYDFVQRQITRGGNIQYFKPNPSVLPENYRPVWRKKRLAIGAYIASTSSKSRNKPAPKAVNADGTLLEEVESLFLQRLGVSTPIEAMERFWPKRPIQNRIRRHLPKNIHVSMHHHVGHSRRTQQFVHLIKKIEHRILHGNDGATQESVPEVGNVLILPRRNNTDTMYPTNTANRIPVRSNQRHITSMLLSNANDLSTEKDQDDAIMITSSQRSITVLSDTEPIILTDSVMKERSLIPRYDDSTSMLVRQTSDIPRSGQAVVDLQRQKSDVSMYERSDLTQPDNQVPALHDGYIKGDSWMEECEDLLLLENRFSRSDSYERDGDHDMMLDDFDDILPLHLKRSQRITETRDTPAKSNFDDYINMEPFAFKQLGKEEADELTISASMLKWLAVKPKASDEAQRVLRARAKNLKLDDAKDWIYATFALPPSPIAPSTPPFDDDDDFDFDLLDQIEENYKNIAEVNPELNNDHSREELKELQCRAKISDEHLTIHQGVQQVHNEEAPMNYHSESKMELDDNKMYSSAGVYDATEAREPINIPSDDFPTADADINDTSFYDLLENKADDEGSHHSSMASTPVHEPSSTTSLSSLAITRKRRRRRIEATEDSDIIRGDIGQTSASSPVMKRAIQGHQRQRRRLDPNPYLDVEAEKSSDEELMGSGHDDDGDEENEGDSKLDDSFINDEGTSESSTPQRDIYRMSLMSQPTGSAFHGNYRRKTWLDKFQADKWMEAQDDDEDEEETGTSGIEEKTDDICQFSDDFE